jgi:hypothetical protein
VNCNFAGIFGSYKGETSSNVNESQNVSTFHDLLHFKVLTPKKNKKSRKELNRRALSLAGETTKVA